MYRTTLWLERVLGRGCCRVNPGRRLLVLCLAALVGASPLRADPAIDREGRGDVDAGERPLAMLLVSVTAAERAWDGADASGSQGGRRYGTGGRDDVQQVQILEGHTAYLNASAARPYPTLVALPAFDGGVALPGVEYREFETGFTVTPLLQGEQLILDIAVQNPQRSEIGEGGIEQAELRTSVRGALGEWIRLGGPGESLARVTGAPGPTKTLSTSARARQGQREIWVRVDRVD